MPLNLITSVINIWPKEGRGGERGEGRGEGGGGGCVNDHFKISMLKLIEQNWFL